MIRKFKNFAHLIIAFIANVIYGFPSRKIYVIGVTGTDGKTTTTNLIYHILKESNEKVAMISTVGAAIGGKTYDIGFHVTTPSSFGLQKYIKKAVDEGNKYLVLEVTSHGLDQNRVFGINFQTAVLTNITHEHLDYHKTYENYVKAKMKLLKSVKTAIVNKDDESYEKVSSIKYQVSSIKWITYGLENNADIHPKKFPFESKLIGKFNKYNCLAAISTAKTLGINDEIIRKALKSFTPPAGRQEIIYDKDFKVMIDFAHTPNSFEKVLPDVVKMKSNRLIHVFGSAGKRDKTKRPLMGKASSKFADIIILTAEDPRDESIEKINADIKKGISNFQFPILPAGRQVFNENLNFKFEKNKKYLFEIPDRKKAIEFAISLAKKGDFVIMTGKSHEKSMNYGKGEEPWDEFGTAREALKKRFGKSV